MKIARCFLALIAIVLTTAMVTTPAWAQTVVNGLNTYPTDQNNVQSALNAIAPGGTVTLKGTFDFGPDGSVAVSKKDVTLTGDVAVIRGGGTASAAAYNFAVLVSAGGVKISNIKFIDPIPVVSPRIPCAIYVNAPGSVLSDNVIIVQDNEITTNYIGINFRVVNCPARASNNIIHCNPLRGGMGVLLLACRNLTEVRNNIVEGVGAYGICAQSNGPATGSMFPIMIIGNHITASHTMNPPGAYAGIWALSNTCPLQIEDNQFEAIADQPGDIPGSITCGILVQGLNVNNSTGPDRDNPPVTIARNSITIRNPFPATPAYESIGLEVGNDYAGLSNATVLENKLAGTMGVGLWREMYGDSIVFLNNDLSDLKTSLTQLGILGGRATTVRGNIFGFSNAIPGQSDALELFSMKYNFAWLPMPSPTEGCIIADNDYRLTGLPGWSDGGSGCISIFSMADRGGLGTAVSGNLINETGRFPAGTGGAINQIAQWKSALVHDNRIVGLPAAGLDAPGIGQEMKEARLMALASLSEMKKGMGVEGLDTDPGGALSKDAGETTLLPAAAPSSWVLHNNYPNPFNPSTMIRYGLPYRSHVTLTVFNTLGQKVAELVNGEREAGYHEVKFDAGGLASGVYFYRLQAGSFVDTKKLMLTR